VGGGLLVLALVLFVVIAIPLFTQQQGKAEDTYAQADLRALANEIASGYAYSSDQQINVSVDGDNYLVTVYGSSSFDSYEVTIPRASGVELQPSSHFESRDSWCVGVHTDAGTVNDFAFTALGGMIEGAVCDTSGGTATVIN
jgi:hypothetical protein